MSLEGFTSPRTPEGRSSLVPRPPWHYVGAFLVIDYWADPDEGRRVPPRGARSPPRSRPLRVRRADWQSCSESGGRAGRPVALAVQGGLRRRERAPRGRGGDDLRVHLGRPRLRARARLDPGVPEEARLDLDHAELRPRRARRPGDGGGGAVRRHLRRVRAPGRGGHRDARAAVRAAARSTTPRRSSTSATSRGSPRETTTRPPCTSSSRRAAATARSRRSGRAPRRSSSSAPTNEENDALAPVRIGRGFRFTFAYTVDDLETVRDLRGRESASSRGRGRRRRDRPLHRRRARRERRTFVDLSPIDAEPIAEVARGGEREADLAVAAATEAFPDWAALGPDGRAAHLHRLADLIDASVERLAAVECVDMAMLLRSLRARVISRGARNFRAYADLAVALRGAGLGVERHRATASCGCRAARRS